MKSCKQSPEIKWKKWFKLCESQEYHYMFICRVDAEGEIFA